MSTDEKILDELQTIKNILVLSNSEKIDNILVKIINTENRKKMWQSIDGKNMPKNIAEK